MCKLTSQLLFAATISAICLTMPQAVLPDGVRCVGRSAPVLHVNRLKYLGSFMIGVQLEVNGCWVREGQHPNAADCRVVVVFVHVQRVDQQFQEPGHPLYVLQPYAAWRVEGKYDVWAPRTVCTEPSSSYWCWLGLQFSHGLYTISTLKYDIVYADGSAND